MVERTVWSLYFRNEPWLTSPHKVYGAYQYTMLHYNIVIICWWQSMNCRNSLIHYQAEAAQHKTHKSVTTHIQNAGEFDQCITITDARISQCDTKQVTWRLTTLTTETESIHLKVPVYNHADFRSQMMSTEWSRSKVTAYNNYYNKFRRVPCLCYTDWQG